MTSPAIPARFTTAAARPDKLVRALFELWDRYVEENGVIIGPVSLFDVDPRRTDRAGADRRPPAMQRDPRLGSDPSNPLEVFSCAAHVPTLGNENSPTSVVGATALVTACVAALILACGSTGGVARPTKPSRRPR